MAERFIRARLSDPSHFVPLHGKEAFFPKDENGMSIDTFDAYFKLLLDDGSLVPIQEPKALVQSQEPDADYDNEAE